MHSLHLCHLGQLVHALLCQHCESQWQKLSYMNWLNNFVRWVLTNTKKSFYCMPTAIYPFTRLILNLLIPDLLIFFFPYSWPAVQAIQCYYLWVHIYSQLVSLLSNREIEWPSAKEPKALPLRRVLSHYHHLRLSLKVGQLHPHTEPAHLSTKLWLFLSDHKGSLTQT